MHHLLEIFLWLLLAFIVGWLIGWFVQCVLLAGARRADRFGDTAQAAAEPTRLAAAEEAAGEAPRAATATGDDAATSTTDAAGESAESATKAEESAAEADRQTQPALQAHGLAAPVGGRPDDLQLISGIGPKLEKMLHELGIFHFSQIAAWTEKDIAEINDRLKFKGRIEREEWVRQAKLLAAGKMEQFEREYGTGGKKDASGKTRAGTRTRKAAAKGASEKVAASRDKGAAADDSAGGEEKIKPHGLSAPIGGKPDDLQLISGIGPKLEKMLHELGIFHYSQIAAWTKKDIAEIDDKLKFKGRIERDEWVRQAKLLAAGKMEQFEREYGTGGKKDASGKTRAGTRTRRGGKS